MLRYGLAGLPPAAILRGERLARVGIALAAALLVGGLPLAVLGVTTAGLVAGPLLGVGALLLSPTPVVARLARQVLLPPGDARHEEAALEDARGAGERPALLGRYRVVRELGRGGSATALLATDALKGTPVVVKRFHAPSSRQAVAEARALAAVRHPRVVPLLDVERVGAETFLVLGHVPGGTARDALDRDGPLPPARAVELALDVLEALEALHGRGIVHGDVKPENVLLDAEGRGVLGDLGSARFVAVDVTATGAEGGVSLSTVAPEVLRGERPAPASDLYAAGALLHRLLTGRHYVALEGATAFEARERVLLDPPRLPDPRVPPAVEALLRRALAKRPALRPRSAREMAEALRAASLRLEDERRAPHADHVAGPEGAGLAL
jgi:serine/threonine-protein kinase